MKNSLTILSLLVALFMGGISTAQTKLDSPKLSPALSSSSYTKNNIKQYVVVVAGSQVPAALNDSTLLSTKMGCSGSYCFYKITTDLEWIYKHLLPLASVLFIEDGERIAKEEMLIGSLDISTNRINVVHDRYPQWNGNGINTSLKENKPDTTDIDLRGRYISSPIASNTVTDHATVMATMMIGGGNTWHLGKGAAWGARLSSSNFSNLLPDDPVYFTQYNLSIQNHSYGVAVESYYGADAVAYDAAVIGNPTLLHIFSSGNSGTAAATSGRYAALPGFANLTGSFKMAKNILTVGATDSFGIVAALSSRGPAHDGRIKPELVAYGEDGSSGAAALVSGTTAILQQAYKQINGSLPPNALLRAVMVNSTDDTGTPGPDYATGFGNLNAFNAVKTVEAHNHLSGTVSNGTSQQFPLAVPTGIKKLKLTLTWNDPPAAPNALKALVNDLDIELVNAASNETFLPWTLSSFPNSDSLLRAATRTRDTLNNTEQITIDDPQPGNYNVNVKGSRLPAGPQTFFIAYQLNAADSFDWQFPTKMDFIFPSSPNLIRWEQTFSNVVGTLDYSVNSGSSWQTISSGVDLSKKYFMWNVPSLNGKILLRMTIGTKSFVSDGFVVAARTNLAAGFNCPDSFQLYWNRTPSATAYRVYEMGPVYLQPVGTLSDTFIVLNKGQHPSLHYAVAPILNNQEAVRSYTINYTVQGVACYVRSFFATLSGNTAVMDLELGSLFNISKIVLEKLVGGTFVPIQQLSSLVNLNVRFVDPSLLTGGNTYRIKLELANGRAVYSSPETVYYFSGEDYIIFPNPASQASGVRIAVREVRNDLMQVYNSIGIKIYEKILDDRVNEIPANLLPKGVVFIRISEGNVTRYAGRAVIL